MVDDPEGRAKDFDKRVPEDRKSEAEIARYMRGRYGHVLPDSFIDQVAPRIATIREAEAGETSMATGADWAYDPNADRFRDPDTGHFL